MERKSHNSAKSIFCVKVKILNERYDPYKKIGLKSVVNAATSLTLLGGSMPKVEVFEAMQDASRGFIIIPKLQKRAGELLAEMLGAEAGLPAAGAVNALMLAVAACMFKGTELEDYDPVGSVPWVDIIQRLPLKTEGMKTEFIILGNSRSTYDHAIECAGGTRVQAGYKDGVSIQELRDAFNPDSTAAYYYTLTPSADVPIKEFCDLAHSLGVPAIVDAAPHLTHASIPSVILDAGADLVILSGGKQLGSINNTGILLGKKDLIKLAHLNAYPFDGIGRGAKMSREMIMGLLKAVELFVAEDRDEYYSEMLGKSRELAAKLDAIDGIVAGTLNEPSLDADVVPPSYTWVEMDDSKLTLKGLFDGLMSGDPMIRPLYEPTFISTEVKNRITFKVEYLQPGDDGLIVERVKSLLG
jgi:L-seryl-tRNA(Ser) seleniumtransferase